MDERPASEAEKQKLAEFKAVLREMDEVYGAQKEGYQLKFDSLLLEALYRLLVDYAVRIGKEHIPQNQKAVQQIREVMRYIEEHYAEKLTVAQVAEHFGYTPNYLSKLLKRYLLRVVIAVEYEIAAVYYHERDKHYESHCHRHEKRFLIIFLFLLKHLFFCPPRILLKSNL